MAVENEIGQRRIVAIKNGRVEAWDQGKPTDMGRLKFTTEEQMMDTEIKPINTEIGKLERELELLKANPEWNYRDHLKELTRTAKIKQLEE